MAGHSHWAGIKHKKGRADKERSKIFSKLSREITVAAKLGDKDPDMNPRLRTAIQAAKAANMPKDNISRAISKSEVSSEKNYENLRYEGFGPFNTALIIETLTDNKNRTASEIRTILNKNGGMLGETGSASFNFDKIGEVKYDSQNISKEKFFDFSIDKNALDVIEEGSYIISTCNPENFSKFRDDLELEFGEPKKSELIWKAKNPIKLEPDIEKKVLSFIDLLEENDDIQRVFSNINFNQNLEE